MTISEFDVLGASILIVDDEEANISLLAQVLAKAGYTGVTATTKPREVCALHRKNRYDLILLDLRMPDMDGFDVIRELKASLVDSYLPVIVLTDQPGHKMPALQAGAKDFISKPFDPIEVTTRIRNILEVRLLNKALESYSRLLEEKARERTAELRESEARYRSLVDLACDWYWEQDENGNLTKISGPVLELLGMQVDSSMGKPYDDSKAGWTKPEQEELRAKIADRKPFLDFVIRRILPDGSQRKFRVSGEPMLDRDSRFVGYRGVGLELIASS